MKHIFRALALLLVTCSLHAQHDPLRKQIHAIIRPINADIGIAIKMLDSNDTLTVNGSKHFPMQSVFKFPIAMAMLHQIDEGKFKLSQKIGLTQADYFATHSPLAKKYPEGNADVLLSEILHETVSMSDNVGCDVTFRLLGGPGEVEKYIHSLGVTDIAIRYTEKEMHSDWNIPFKNWSTPLAMLQLLEVFEEGKKLSPESYDFLRTAMVESPTGPKRIRAGLPIEIVLAHKTGTGGRNESGIAGAINDVGIIELPNGRKLGIVVFITNSLETDERLEAVIADVARIVFDYYK